jgi:deazaflavin-dependent oxidoreductase (nitroreductase family)
VPEGTAEEAPSRSEVSQYSARHVARYQDSAGADGYQWSGATVLLLTTNGRRSGQPRTCPLIFGRDGEDYLVAASLGGAPRHPAWYLNLQADPAAQIQVKADHIAVTARTASADERPRLWKILADLWPNYDAYQARTERVIPVVVLSPSRA